MNTVSFSVHVVWKGSNTLSVITFVIFNRFTVVWLIASLGLVVTPLFTL